MIVGDPSTYQTFFHFGKAIYAHETGHLLAHYDLNGFDRFDGSEYNNESLYLQLASILNHGDPSYMYFSGISYQMIPRAILTSSLFGTRGAYYFLNELIAHKFALELVGETEMAKYAANRTGNIGYCPHNNPFYLMSESILARAFGLKDNERAIKAELVKIDPMWLCGSNLPFVEDQFIRFFEQTQVKRLK